MYERPQCSACRIDGRTAPATHASRYDASYAYCEPHAGPGDPLLAIPEPLPVAAPQPPTEPEPPALVICPRCGAERVVNHPCVGCKERRPGPGRYERTYVHQLKHGAGKLHISVDEYRAHIEAGERWCSDCKQWHPADQMVRAFGQRHGLGNICREAARERARQQAARKVAAT